MQSSDNQGFIENVKQTTAVKPTAIILETEASEVEESKKSELLPLTSQKKGAHLFVMVHGFQGSCNDLNNLRNQIAMHNPNALFLMSAANQKQKTEDDITLMGQRLAKEVLKYVQDYCNGPNLQKLSFVTFSMGGLIARASFPLLEDL